MIHNTFYGNSWQEMGKDRIQYMTCTIQNDTNNDFTVISVQTKPPYSSPYKGIVRGIQPTTQIPGGTQISFQMGDKRARHWFSAVLEIVFRCTSSSSGNWYMHMFWYPTESGLHVAFSEHPQFSWSHLMTLGL
ncbi:hypothetical protein BCR33DRAFT_784753 [Rhizoclosmatium globosum]|uniref:Uncharacterized protein n=1 Tax=Rhizoclosmatium globosum TaxID=329046 RepID=A0A1Y2CE79_9FUNG|nr:hypothetical protein BCR33DRAFT_784753 [Rhizoclosmatium globosum]|eukprot:ORY45370.1 hypothetical protein BCR33DRAFT_784753 [Rhizoclosmatium globosum]